MRFRVDVAARAPDIPWSQVHSPARGVGYALIASQDEQLATQLHDHGWAGSPLVPLGVSPPLFQGAPRHPGRYTTSDHGSVWLGSPVPQIAAALLAGIAGRSEIQWGSVALTVKGVQLEDIPDHQAGQAVFESRTPVLVHHDSHYILPDHQAYPERLRHNLAHRADIHTGRAGGAYQARRAGAGGADRLVDGDHLGPNARRRLRWRAAAGPERQLQRDLADRGHHHSRVPGCVQAGSCLSAKRGTRCPRPLRRRSAWCHGGTMLGEQRQRRGHRRGTLAPVFHHTGHGPE